MKNTNAKEVKVRQLTVCNKYSARSNGVGINYPVIVLTGKWFEDIGFKPGHVIDVTYSNKGSLVITLAKEQRFEHLKVR